MLVDSNVWIFAENEHAEEYTVARACAKNALENGFIINVIVASETFHILSLLSNPEDARRRVRNLIEYPTAQWLPFPAPLVVKALSLSQTCNVRINDALLAQQALEQDCPILTDNVKDFRKVKGLDIIPLR